MLALGGKIGAEVAAAAIDFMAAGAIAGAEENRFAGLRVAARQLCLVAAAGKTLDIGHQPPDIVRRQGGKEGISVPATPPRIVVKTSLSLPP